MNQSTREITTSIWAITAAMQERLERAGLDEARVDAVVTRGLGKLMSQGARVRPSRCRNRRPAERAPQPRGSCDKGVAAFR